MRGVNTATLRVRPEIRNRTSFPSHWTSKTATLLAASFLFLPWSDSGLPSDPPSHSCSIQHERPSHGNTNCSFHSIICSCFLIWSPSVSFDDFGSVIHPNWPNAWSRQLSHGLRILSFCMWHRGLARGNCDCGLVDYYQCVNDGKNGSEKLGFGIFIFLFFYFFFFFQSVRAGFCLRGGCKHGMSYEEWYFLVQRSEEAGGTKLKHILKRRVVWWGSHVCPCCLWH